MWNNTVHLQNLSTIELEVSEYTMVKKPHLKLCQIEGFEHVGLNWAFLSVTIESNLLTKGNNIKAKALGDENIQNLLYIKACSLKSSRYCVQCIYMHGVQKPNLWTNNFVEVSGHNLESSQTRGFRIQRLHYKSV